MLIMNNTTTTPRCLYNDFKPLEQELYDHIPRHLLRSTKSWLCKTIEESLDDNSK